MRILHVITTINRGGAENHLAELMLGQVARGLDVAVAFLKGDQYWTTRLGAAGISVQPLGLARYGDLAPVIRLRRLIRDWAPALVHAHLPPAELYTRLALLGFGPKPPLVISKHNDEPFYRGPAHGTFCRWVARRASRMIAISNAVRIYMRDRMELPDGMMRIIHYGTDCRPFDTVDDRTRQQLRAEWGVADEGMVIGTLARLVPQKALHVMLAAFAQYRSMSKQRAQLVIVGRGPLLAELQEAACRLDVSEAVVWAGYREDVPALMHAFDVFALTSSHEGFGLVLLEAMAAGRPVVATAVSAIPEVVQDGETGLLCAPGDSEAVARAFLRLEDADLRARLGRNGRVRGREHFTLDRMIDATIAVYRECLA
ncbi:MAG: glycosyltransferase [Rhizobiales bacterium]|nr:glycosyltransferase [Hyphomicrobiales bacterium]